MRWDGKPLNLNAKKTKKKKRERRVFKFPYYY